VTSGLVLRMTLCALLGSAACTHAVPIDPGEDALAIRPETVLTFDYETADSYVSAHRFAVRDPFHVVAQTHLDNGLVHCTGDESFEQLLRDFESLKIRRRLTESELAELGQARAYHRLRLASAPPVEAYEAVLTPLSNGLLAIDLEGQTYELGLSTRAVEQLGHSCSLASDRAQSAREADSWRASGQP
jgi:hypothetical protein